MKAETDTKTIDSALNRMRSMLTEHYCRPEKNKISIYKTKEELVQAFGEPIPPEEGMGLDEALDLVRDKLLPLSVKTWHPMFMNQMSAGASFPSLIAEAFSTLINGSMTPGEPSPETTIIEGNVTRWMAGILGMPQGSGGILLPGGSVSNLMALAVARNTRLYAGVHREGIGNTGLQGAILCSEASHYSISNAANILGIGSHQLIRVATNEKYEMLIDDLCAKLDECKKRNLHPFALVATLGATVTGGFDPLAQIAPICRKNNIHLHIDAAFGGSMAMTEIGRDYFKGIEYADTVIWDAHKWMHVPLACTALLAPDPLVFEQVFSGGSPTLPVAGESGLEPAEDVGQNKLCGKQFDGLCVWFLFKAFGKKAFVNMVEERVRTAFAIADAIDRDPDFILSFSPKSALVCFRYLPTDTRGCSSAYRDTLQRTIREECKYRGHAYFNIAKLNGEYHFRMILINQLTTREHILDLLEKMRAIGRDFMVRSPPDN